MARTLKRSWATSVFLTAAASAATAFAGPLSPPPGPVAPTGKPLSQVEPRTAINDLPGSAVALHVIEQPGSYYLTGDIVGQTGLDGILIGLLVDGAVSIDLNGFSLRGVAGSGDAIRIVGMPPIGISIGNGTIHNWGGAGVSSSTNPPQSNMNIENVHIDTVLAALLIPAVQKARARSCSSKNSSGDGFVVGDDAVIVDSFIQGSGGVGVKAGNGLVLKGSKILQNAVGAVEGGIDGVMRDNVVEGAMTLGQHWSVQHNIFILDLDNAAFQPIRFNGGLHHVKDNEFNIHGTNTLALPAVSIAGDRNLFRGNDLVMVEPPPPLPQVALRNPAAYIKYDGVDGECRMEDNTFTGLHPGTEAIQIATGAGSVVIGNRISGTAQGGVVGVLLQADSCFVAGNTMTRIGSNGVGIMDQGLNNVVAPQVFGSGIAVNTNPDRNFIMP